MLTIRNARWPAAALAATTLVVGCGDSETETSSAPVPAAQPKATPPEARANLTTADGAPIGTVLFTPVPGATEVDVRLTSSKVVKAGSFHGLHVHANDDPANGEGCTADAAAPQATWFTSADGHLKEGTATHTDHKGDLPSVLVHEDGAANLRFTTDRFTPAQVVGKAVVLHAAADNFGNIPVGSAPDQYKANSETASAKTSTTGNAGDRVACGLIRKG